jgi:hypothetical protein
MKGARSSRPDIARIYASPRDSAAPKTLYGCTLLSSRSLAARCEQAVITRIAPSYEVMEQVTYLIYSSERHNETGDHEIREGQTDDQVICHGLQVPLHQDGRHHEHVPCNKNTKTPRANNSVIRYVKHLSSNIAIYRLNVYRDEKFKRIIPSSYYNQLDDKPRIILTTPHRCVTRRAEKLRCIAYRAKLAAQLSITLIGFDSSHNRSPAAVPCLCVFFIYYPNECMSTSVPGVLRLTMDDRFDILIDSRDVN